MVLGICEDKGEEEEVDKDAVLCTDTMLEVYEGEVTTGLVVDVKTRLED